MMGAHLASSLLPPPLLLMLLLLLVHWSAAQTANCSAATDCDTCTGSACAWCQSSKSCLALSDFNTSSLNDCEDFGWCIGDQCCSEPWNSLFWPYSSQIPGQLLLMLFYGVILSLGAKYIADGSELLMEIMDPGIIGGLLLPILGALPDGLMIIVSGAFGTTAEAQEQIAVGMGTLAGSTVMLLTLTWGAALWLGRCNLVNGVARDRKLTNRWDIIRTGVTVDDDTPWNGRIALGTTLAYLIIQVLAFVYINDSVLSPHHQELEKWFCFGGFIVCMLLVALYCAYQILNPKLQAMKVEKARREYLLQKSMHYMLKHMKHVAPPMLQGTPTVGDVGRSGPRPIDPVLAETIRGVGLKWKNAALRQLRTGGGASSSAASINHDDSDDIRARLIREQPEWELDIGEDDADDGEDEEEEEHGSDSPRVILMWSLLFMVGGTVVVSIFSDPMVDVIMDLGKNVHIPPFYVSFIITPFCSNASELISSLMFASKKRKKNSSLTYSALYGAATMNNCLCLGIFYFLIWMKGLTWNFTAEALCILLTEWIVLAVASTFTTYPTWLAIPVVLLYPGAIGLVAFLENVVGWT